MRTQNSWIVTVNGWLLIAGSVFAVFQKAHVHAIDEKIVALISLVLCVTVAVGLLLRRNWGRWMALGISLMAWTVGSVIFFFAFWYGVKNLMQTKRSMFRYERSSDETFLLFMIMLFFFAIFAAIIWLNYRLFEHLNSEAGREEFDTPDDEKHPVAKSTAVYVVWCTVAAIIVHPGLVGAGHSSRDDLAEQLEQFRRLRLEAERVKPSPAVREDPGVSMREARQRQQLADENAALTAQRDAAEAAARAEQAAADSMRRQLAQNEARERARAGRETRMGAQQEFRRKLEELTNRRMSDRSYSSAQFEADRQRLGRELESSTRSSLSDAYPGSSSQPATSERSTSAILKCRDSTGAISFTQGYCPAGTNLVESPPAE